MKDSLLRAATAVALCVSLAGCMAGPAALVGHYKREYYAECMGAEPSELGRTARQIAADTLARFGGNVGHAHASQTGATLYLPLTQGAEASRNNSYFMYVGTRGGGVTINLETANHVREDDRAKEIRSYIESELTRFNCPKWNVSSWDVFV
jgi:hypothetical protein